MAVRLAKRKLTVRPDALDFRDKLYVPTLYEVPTEIDLRDYKRYGVPVLDQGTEGACTGYGLATVANYLLRRRKVVPDKEPVSARMLYAMAKRYDEWPGETYEGSSARGAMKGWYKHGVCAEKDWPSRGRKPDGRLTEARTSAALKRPLGAYFRVNHKDLVAMHTALAEVGVLYATGVVHAGWDTIRADGSIPLVGGAQGGHAFAIVAYDRYGFWIQNSWGEEWGAGGFARIGYDDWLMNGTDVWVARLGAPVVLEKSESVAASHSAAAEKSRAYAYSDLRPHIVSIGRDGVLNQGGDFGTSPDEVRAIFLQDFPRATRRWKTKRLLLYAHGGLVDEATAVQRLADYRPAMLAAQIYPVSFIWHSDFWTTAANILEDAIRRRRPEGLLDAGKDFMLDRLDDALEPLARALGGKAQWDEMKENAQAATLDEQGGARLAADCIAELRASMPDVEVHLVAHSAGSVFHAPLAHRLAGGDGMDGLVIESCTLWAPACTVDLFKRTYLPAIDAKRIRRFTMFTLTDKAERDDNCADIYHKSLLYLVSDALEALPRIPLFRDGVPLLGMEKFVRADSQLAALFEQAPDAWVRAPNTAPSGSPQASAARHHNDFDDDLPTVKATLARVLDVAQIETELTIHRSASSLRGRRQRIATHTQAR